MFLFSSFFSNYSNFPLSHLYHVSKYFLAVSSSHQREISGIIIFTGKFACSMKFIYIMWLTKKASCFEKLTTTEHRLTYIGKVNRFSQLNWKLCMCFLFVLQSFFLSNCYYCFTVCFPHSNTKQMVYFVWLNVPIENVLSFVLIMTQIRFLKLLCGALSLTKPAKVSPLRHTYAKKEKFTKIHERD